MKQPENQKPLSKFVDSTRVLHMLGILKTTAHVNAVTLSRDDQTSTDQLDRALAIRWFQDMERVIDDNMSHVTASAETCKQLKQRCDWY